MHARPPWPPSGKVNSGQSTHTPPPTPPQSPRHQNLTNQSLTNTCLILILGREPTQTRFCVNKQLLCHHSPILNVVLNHDVEYEDGVQVYRVEAAGHRLAFAFLIQWFNRKKIDPLLGEEGLLIPASYFTRADRHRLMNGEDMALIRAWLVADRWEVPECRAYIERRIRGRYGHFRHGSVDCLVYVWRSTSVGSSNEGLREVYWPVFQWVVRTYNIGAFELEELLSSEEANLPLP